MSHMSYLHAAVAGQAVAGRRDRTPPVRQLVFHVHHLDVVLLQEALAQEAALLEGGVVGALLNALTSKHTVKMLI